MKRLPSLGAWWRRAARPSLGRRLLLAQMGMLTALWTLLTAALLWSAHSNNDLLSSDAVYDLAITIADSLPGDPARQAQSLHAFDAALRAEYGNDVDDGSPTPVLFVWQGGRCVYQSHPNLPVVRNRQADAVEDIDVQGRTWRMRTRRSATTGTEVGIAIRDLPQRFLTFNSRGYYLLPLLVSLPFLAFPAWWSVRLALRPWRRVSEEIATRGPDDLAPLSFQPRHAELRPFVRSINMLLSRVRESAARERSLIADAAHELRTPLAAMRVNVEALHQQAPSPAQRELMHSLLRSNERATRMVHQLLQLMRNEAAAGTGAPEVLAFTALLQDRLAVLDGLAAAHGVELELHAAPGLAVVGEREGLVSMVDNLLDNAIKYSPRGGTVTVTAALECTAPAPLPAGRRPPARGPQPSHPRPLQVLLEVSDRGPGIAAPLRGRVFDRFFRVPDQMQSGSGLGLSIVRGVVQRHGGEISLHDAVEGLGLRVRIVLPTPGPGAPDVAAAAAEDSGPSVPDGGAATQRRRGARMPDGAPLR